EGGLDIAGGKRGGAFRKAVEQERQERRARARPLDRIRKIRFTNCFFPTTGCRSSVPPAQRLKPGTPTHVNRDVKQLDRRMKLRGEIQPRSYVEMAPPSVH